jgi:hypothetical protein
MIVVCILVRVHVRWPRFQASIEIIQRGQHMIRREIHCETRCAIYIYRNAISMFPPLTHDQLEALFGKMVRLRNIQRIRLISTSQDPSNLRYWPHHPGSEGALTISR